LLEPSTGGNNQLDGWKIEEEGVSQREAQVQCVENTMQLFSLSFCRAFSTLDQSYARNKQLLLSIVERIISHTKMSVSQAIKEYNSCKFKQWGRVFSCEKLMWCNTDDIESKALHHLLESLDALNVHVADCEQHDDQVLISNHLRLKETELLDAIENTIAFNETDYISNVIQFTAQPAFRLFRRWFVDRNNLFNKNAFISKHVFKEHSKDGGGSTHWDESVQSDHHKQHIVNAWYDPGNHKIVIPVATLKSPLFYEKYDNASMFALAGFIFAHELMHSTESSVYTEPVVSNYGSCPMAHFFEFLLLYSDDKRRIDHVTKNVRETNAHYEAIAKSNPYAVNTFFENRADVLGLQIVIEVWLKQEGL